MTTPDHTPFLRPGVDLCTAEDVARWLRQFVVGTCLDADEIYARLTARLDRERLQACRRAALAKWREFANLSRELSDRGAAGGAILRAVLDDPEWWGPRTAAILGALSAALAFRAAARAR